MFLVSFLCVGARGEPTDLGYAVMSPFRPDRPVGDLDSRTLVATEGPAKKLKAEPDYKSSHPWYLAARLGRADDNVYVMALDFTSEGKPQPDLLYVDRDNDGDLREERPLRSVRYDRNGVFALAHVLLDHGGHRSIYHFSVRQGRSNRRFRLSSCCYHVGMVRIAGKDYRVAVADRNGNGTYDDVATIPGEGDRLFVDRDGDGKWEGALERFGLGKCNWFGDEYYSFSVAWDGATVGVARSDLPCGSIQLSHRATSIWLCSENGCFWLSPRGGKVSVPVGSYRLSGLRLTEKDENGDTWSIAAETDETKMIPCVVREGQTSVMKLGPPLLGKVTGYPWLDNVDFEMEVTGQAGEEYHTYRARA